MLMGKRRRDNMRIAVASGKGGTGKTTIASNLAYYLVGIGKNVTLVDCDVEEPNDHLFLTPQWENRFTVSVPVPEVDKEKCTACGLCSELCQFSAIACINEIVLTFPELCHGCGLCSRICPPGAIKEIPREVGVVESGHADGIYFVHGKLRIGEAMSPPLIKEVKMQSPAYGITIIDSPPGTSCPVIEAIKETDFVLLVTEPTPFGLNDLQLAVEMVREVGIPFAVVINRSNIGDDRVFKYCEKESIPILMEIPEDRRIAEVYSMGKLILKEIPIYTAKFSTLATALVL